MRRPYRKRRKLTQADDQVLLASYRATGSVGSTAAALDANKSYVHQRLRELGVCKPPNFFTKADDERLMREYLTYRAAGRVRDLAKEMGRTVPFLSRQAKRLGLSGHSHDKPYRRVWKGMSEEAARVWMDKFKDSRLPMKRFCIKEGIDDLGFWRALRGHFPDEWDAVVESKCPRQTMYRLGRAFEYRVRDRLRALGYFVLRSPASRSPVDLVAIRFGEVLFIQCKRGGYCGVAEWNQLLALAESVGATPLIASFENGRGMDLFRITDKKDGSRRRQPMVPFVPTKGRAA